MYMEYKYILEIYKYIINYFVELKDFKGVKVVNITDRMETAYINCFNNIDLLNEAITKFENQEDCEVEIDKINMEIFTKRLQRKNIF